MCLTSVDLPAPLSPTSARTSPAVNVRLAPRSALTGPNFLCRSTTSSRGGTAALRCASLPRFPITRLKGTPAARGPLTSIPGRFLAAGRGIVEKTQRANIRQHTDRAREAGAEMEKSGEENMLGLMQERPLLISSLVDYASGWHGSREIVSRDPDGALRRSTYAQIAARAKRVANALDALGLKAGDRVATLAWNGFRHLELYYGVTSSARVLHTVNPRLFPDQLRYIMHHAEDAYVFFDPVFAPLVDELAPKLPLVRGWVALSDREGPISERRRGASLPPGPRLPRCAGPRCRSPAIAPSPRRPSRRKRARARHPSARSQAACRRRSGRLSRRAGAPESRA